MRALSCILPTMVKAADTRQFRALLPGSAFPASTPGVVLVFLVFPHPLGPCLCLLDRSLGWTICLGTILRALPAPGPCCHPPARGTPQSSA